MRVLVAGSHGKIGRRLTRLLTAGGHEVVAMIRDPDQAAELRDLGAEPLVADLTGDVSAVPAGCDAVVFTAGAGPGSGPGPKQTVDRGGAEKLVDAAAALGVRYFVLVSSRGAHDPGAGGERMRPYLEAKRQADEHLAASDLDWVIVRPGALGDEPGDGHISASLDPAGGGAIPRDDVARTIAALLQRQDLARRIITLADGPDPIEHALDALAG